MRLRSVELHLPEIAAAADFLERVWGLLPAGARGASRYFRGTGDHPYVLMLAPAQTPSVRAIEFSGAPDEIGRTQTHARSAGAQVTAFAEFDAPGGGAGFEAIGPEAQRYRFVTEDAPPPGLPAERDRPVQLTHAVVNALDVAAAERFAVDALGFKVSDRTRLMTFVRCNRKHHALAYAHAEVASLNHIAFEMHDSEAVMRGIGRLKDAGFEPVWGPGRHGPGNNVFGYFVAPWNGIVEYTAEVAEVSDDYRVGAPEDWTWPPGRIDHWGISRKDTARCAAAERTLRFT